MHSSSLIARARRLTDTQMPQAGAAAGKLAAAAGAAATEQQHGAIGSIGALGRANSSADPPGELRVMKTVGQQLCRQRRVLGWQGADHNAARVDAIACRVVVS
jgi:hypothetical protein